MDTTITILGATATGKTKFATLLANEIDGEIISADSRQVYCTMDIGTGKDLIDYQVNGKQIPVHLINIAQPGTEYNVFQYQQAAHQAIADIQTRYKKVIICGGSGMYLEALLKGYQLFSVPVNHQIRKLLSQKSDKELADMLSSMRPLHNHTDTCERNRLIRALEIQIFYNENPIYTTYSKSVPSILFGLTGERNIIRKRITQRLIERLDSGMIEEVQQLIESGVNIYQLIRYGLEYKYITLYLQNQMDKKTMFERLNVAIHQFSKRQMTWFRKMERNGFIIHWIDIEMDEIERLKLALSIIHNQ